MCRALQNFLSWLNLLTDYSDLMGDTNEILNKNLILLIDEMDLYLHPEWQRTFLVRLIRELAHFGRRKIQIIFATHSPLCLSDVPRENIVYLSRDDSRSVADGPPPFRVDDPESHKQTFGAPVFTLLDDAFFLKNKGTMGEFSEAYINGVLGDIRNLRNECRENKLTQEALQERIDDIRAAARPIGNELLQRQIARMLAWIEEDARRGDWR